MENCKSNTHPQKRKYQRLQQLSSNFSTKYLFKNIERAAHKQLIFHLEINDLLSKTQFGYRKNRSTELATRLLCDNIRKAIDENNIVGMLYVDLSKVFNTLSHFALLESLKSFGITGDAHNWFTDSFLIGSNFV